MCLCIGGYVKARETWPSQAPFVSPFMGRLGNFWKLHCMAISYTLQHVLHLLEHRRGACLWVRCDHCIPPVRKKPHPRVSWAQTLKGSCIGWMKST